MKTPDALGLGRGRKKREGETQGGAKRKVKEDGKGHTAKTQANKPKNAFQGGSDLD